MTESILSADSITELTQMLRVKASSYWDTHYIPGKCSPPSVKFLGLQSIHMLIINVIVPFLYMLGETEQKKSGSKLARTILLDLQAESNQIIKNWINFGIKPCNAFESQALIQLHNYYCQQKRCLDCQLGRFFLASHLYER